MQNHLLTELNESEARFRAAFDSSAIGMGLLSLDGKILQVNDAVVKMSGFSREELIGRFDYQNALPEEQNIGMDLFQELLDGKRDWYQVEKRYLRKNGEVFWTRLTLSAVRDPQGKPLYLVGLIDDIDEEKNARDQLQESEARFRAMFNNAVVGITLIAPDRRVLAINPAVVKMSGYSEAELLAMTGQDITHPEDMTIGSLEFSELLAGKCNNFTIEKRYVHKNGSVYWARIILSAVRDEDGMLLYLVAITENIDQQKQAQTKLAEQEADYLRMLQQRVRERTRELEETNQRLQQEIEQRKRIEKELAEKAADEAVTADRTRLARDLHDAVTQTLFSASLTAEVLPDLWEMDVEEAKRSTEELRQLTRGALAEMRTLLLELRPAALTQTRLNDLIKQLCEAFIGRSRLPIRLTIEGERHLPPEVQVAFYRIAQESLNNVFKYARATQVNVNLFLSANNVHFEVCDNGIGFDLSTAKPTSLGLRIMRERAEAIGADLSISSTPGKGTYLDVTWHEDPHHKLRVL